MKPVVRTGEADKKLVVGCCSQRTLHKMHCMPAAGPLPCFDSTASNPSLIVFGKFAVLDENGAVKDEDDSGDHAIVATGRLRMGCGVAAKDEADLAARCQWKFNETVTTLVARSCGVIDENGAGEDEGDSGDHAIVAAGRLRMDHGVAAKTEADVVARHN